MQVMHIMHMGIDVHSLLGKVFPIGFHSQTQSPNTGPGKVQVAHGRPADSEVVHMICQKHT